MSILCKLGWHNWTRWRFVTHISKPPHREVYDGIALNFCGLEMDVHDRECLSCGKEEQSTLREREAVRSEGYIAEASETIN